MLEKRAYVEAKEAEGGGDEALGPEEEVQERLIDGLEDGGPPGRAMEVGRDILSRPEEFSADRVEGCCAAFIASPPEGRGAPDTPPRRRPENGDETR